MRSDGWFQVQWNPKNAFFQGLELGLIQKSHQATSCKKGSSIKVCQHNKIQNSSATPISLLEKKSFPTIPLLGAIGGLWRQFLLD